MALEAQAIAWIERTLSAPDADARALADFRREFPRLTLTRCDLGDLGVEQPFLQYARFNVYLLDTSDHCFHLTLDPARATGVIVAEKPGGRA